MLRFRSFRLIRQFSGVVPEKFDTNKFVESLEQSGFNRQQAEGVLEALDHVMDERLSGTMVTKTTASSSLFKYKTDLATLKNEMAMLEKNDLAQAKQENQNLAEQVDKMQNRIKEEVSRMQAGFKLDLNLEKGRIKSEYRELEAKIHATEAKIETEISNVRTVIEAMKFEIIRYIIGKRLFNFWCDDRWCCSFHGRFEIIKVIQLKAFPPFLRSCKAAVHEATG